VLTGSGVDEAWTTGVLLAEGVIELLTRERPFTRENLEDAYVKRRRESWIETEGRVAEHARDGFQRGFIRGLLGMALAGLTGGRLHLRGRPQSPREHIPSLAEYYGDRIPASELETIRKTCESTGTALHDTLMDRCGWPRVQYDGKLLVSHQDALLLGGKVQAPPGYANHIVFRDPSLCEACQKKLCIGVCSGQAITPGEDGVPSFDREKCVHCGACLWNCTQMRDGDPERGNIELRAGAGGLHSVEN
jgi:electron-transferring-flavoprotein dehydrogenase